MSRSLPPFISIWDSVALTALFESASISPLHAHKISNYLCNHLYKNPSILQQTGMEWLQELSLTQRAVEIVKQNCRICTSKVAEVIESGDRSTTKLVIELWDGKKIETVWTTAREMAANGRNRSKTNRARRRQQLRDFQFDPDAYQKA